MSADPWDEVAKEADLLRGAIITGTLRARHVELGPVDPKYPDNDAQRAERHEQARERAHDRHVRYRNQRAMNAALRKIYRRP